MLVVVCKPMGLVYALTNIIGYRLQVIGYRLKVTGYRLHVTGYRLPMTCFVVVVIYINLNSIRGQIEKVQERYPYS